MLTELLLQLRAQDGQDLVEYGLALSLIALVGLVAVMLMGDNVIALHAGNAVALLNGAGS